ncbi:MAG: hypothetical protein RB296_04810 [Acidobacteriota bacterium]|jgi:hypothetical protein|nr:hypothetical protein [Acidobacteriota bacterium]
MHESGQDDLDVLRRIAGGSVTAEELSRLSYEFAHRQRIQIALIQHPRFPQRRALNILASLFPADLMRVIRNKRTNPLVRKRGEIEFVNKFQRLPLGEKLSCLKTAPAELLLHFQTTPDVRLLKAILNNPYCTEPIVLRMLQSRGDHQGLYQALDGTAWCRRPAVASVISRDPQAPVKILLSLLPLLNQEDREGLLRRPGTHESVRGRIRMMRTQS